MEKRYFEEYGFLSWIEPTQYYAEPWSYVGFAYDENGEEWDLVRNGKTNEYAYTTV